MDASTDGAPEHEAGAWRRVPGQVWRALGNRYLLLALRLIIGGILLFSAVGKLAAGQSEFVGIVQAHGLLPSILADLYGYALPWIELIIGAFLVCGLLTRFAAGVTILMVISFIVANGTAVYDRVQVSDTPCGCFRWITVKTGDALILDAVMIVFAILLLLRAQGMFTLDKVFRRMYHMDEPLPDEEAGYQPEEGPAD